MTPQDQKFKRADYLQRMIYKYLTTEPKISEEELGYIMWEYFDLYGGDVKKFIRYVKKEI
jgi:hypothetical protein